MSDSFDFKVNCKFEDIISFTIMGRITSVLNYIKLVRKDEEIEGFFSTDIQGFIEAFNQWRKEKGKKPLEKIADGYVTYINR